MIAIAVTGSAARGKPNCTEVDLLIIADGNWSQRVRGHYKGIDIDVFVEGIAALEQDLEERRSSLHVNLLRDALAISDPKNVLAELRKRAASIAAGPRNCGPTGLREQMRPFDLYRKLVSDLEAPEYAYVAANFIEACLTTLYRRNGWWLVGNASLLADAKRHDERAHELACSLLDRQSGNQESRLDAALKLAEIATGRKIGMPLSLVGSMEHRHPLGHLAS